MWVFLMQKSSNVLTHKSLNNCLTSGHVVDEESRIVVWPSALEEFR